MGGPVRPRSTPTGQMYEYRIDLFAWYCGISEAEGIKPADTREILTSKIRDFVDCYF